MLLDSWNVVNTIQIMMTLLQYLFCSFGLKLCKEKKTMTIFLHTVHFEAVALLTKY